MVHYPTSCGVAEETVFVVDRKTGEEVDNVNVESCLTTNIYNIFHNEQNHLTLSI